MRESGWDSSRCIGAFSSGCGDALEECVIHPCRRSLFPPSSPMAPTAAVARQQRKLLGFDRDENELFPTLRLCHRDLCIPVLASLHRRTHTIPQYHRLSAVKEQKRQKEQTMYLTSGSLSWGDFANRVVIIARLSSAVVEGWDSHGRERRRRKRPCRHSRARYLSLIED